MPASDSQPVSAAAPAGSPRAWPLPEADRGRVERVLVGGPVRQDPDVLAAFLDSLARLQTPGVTLEFAFVDDNVDPLSRELLRAFGRGRSMLIVPGSEAAADYQRTETTHHWNEPLFWRVAAFKDRLIQLALARGVDALFLIDSDLVLHPATLERLIDARVDLISEVFWTRWKPHLPENPQVWLGGQHRLHALAHRGEQPGPEEILRREEAFFAQLRRPGVYPVGGLGACTLVSQRALRMGVGFREVPNLDLVGEDRHFCVRAAALGLALYVDTHYPALHLYRPLDLQRLPSYVAGFERQSREVAALDAFRSAIAAWGSAHYARMTGHEGEALLARGLRAARALDAAERVQAARAAGSVSRLGVVWARAIASDEATVEAVTIEARLEQAGREHDRSFADAHGVKAAMRLEEGEWRLASLEFEPAPAPAIARPYVRRTRGNRVMLSMLVHNEADRYLRQVLAHAARYVDSVLIVDDHSSDDSVAVCREVLAGIPHEIVTLEQGEFASEHRLRRKQWELAREIAPEWLLVLDADEQFEDRMAREIHGLLDQDRADLVSFRLYDFWDERHYREDGHWQAHQIFRPFLVRNRPDLADDWLEADQHCGRLPPGVLALPTAQSDLRLKHFGWARSADRLAKLARYRALDPDARHGSQAQYEAILDPHPRLIPWQE